jgi:hypothetical protein
MSEILSFNGKLVKSNGVIIKGKPPIIKNNFLYTATRNDSSNWETLETNYIYKRKVDDLTLQQTYTFNNTNINSITFITDNIALIGITEIIEIDDYWFEHVDSILKFDFSTSTILNKYELVLYNAVNDIKINNGYIYIFTSCEMDIGGKMIKCDMNLNNISNVLAPIDPQSEWNERFNFGTIHVTDDYIYTILYSMNSYNNYTLYKLNINDLSIISELPLNSYTGTNYITHTILGNTLKIIGHNLSFSVGRFNILTIRLSDNIKIGETSINHGISKGIYHLDGVNMFTLSSYNNNWNVGLRKTDLTNGNIIYSVDFTTNTFNDYLIDYVLYTKGVYLYAIYNLEKIIQLNIDDLTLTGAECLLLPNEKINIVKL